MMKTKKMTMPTDFDQKLTVSEYNSKYPKLLWHSNVVNACIKYYGFYSCLLTDGDKEIKTVVVA
jgi:hypothetical protein